MKTKQSVPAMSSLKEPLQKRSVVKLVMDRIKEAMISGELKPGDYLPSETELTQSLGVGKTSVREAIKMLEAMGIVEVRQGHGTFIRTSPDKDSISPLVFQLILQQGTSKELIQMRMVFEPAFTQMAMEEATEEDLAYIEESIKDFEQKINKGVQTADDDLEFHLRILDATKNPFIIRIGKTVFQLFKASVSRSMKEIPKTALKDHKAILKAMKQRDPEALRTAVLNSYKGWEHILEEIDEEAAR